MLQRVALVPDGVDRLVRRTVTLAPKRGVPMRVEGRREG